MIEITELCQGCCYRFNVIRNETHRLCWEKENFECVCYSKGVVVKYKYLSDGCYQSYSGQCQRFNTDYCQNEFEIKMIQESLKQVIL